MTRPRAARLSGAELGGADARVSRWAAELSPPATNSSPSTVTAAAPAKRLGKMADDGRRVPGWVDHLDDVNRCAGLRAADGLAAENEDPPPSAATAG